MPPPSPQQPRRPSPPPPPGAGAPTRPAARSPQQPIAAPLGTAARGMPQPTRAAPLGPMLPPIPTSSGLYLVVLMAMVVGFYLLLLAALGVTAWALYELIIYTPAMLERIRGGGAIKLLFLLYAGVAIFGWAILRGIFAKAGGDPYGIKLQRLKPEHAPVFRLTDDVALKVNATPIGEIFLTPEADLGVWEESALYLPPGMGKRKLVIGMAAMNYLTLDELRSVLAHEYGHFSHNDTFFSRFIFRVSNSYGTLLDQLSGMKIQYLNPVYWMIRGYCGLYHLIAAAFSRRQEYAADRFAVEAYGGPLFKNALVASHTEGAFFGEVGLREVIELAAKGQGFKNVYSFVTANRKLFDYDKPNGVREMAAAMLAEKSKIFDSHPCLRDRLQAQGMTPALEKPFTPPRIAPVESLDGLLDADKQAVVRLGPPSAAEALFGPRLPALQAELSDMLSSKYMYLIQMAQQQEAASA